MTATEKTTTVLATIKAVERLKNTPSGNPRWRVSTGHGTYTTVPDAQGVHAIGGHLVDRLCNVTLDRHGSILRVEVNR